MGVDLIVSQVSGLLVPENAIVKTGQGAFIYVLDKNIIRIKEVSLLGTGTGQAAVSGALQAGDTVAVGQENRLLSLKEGSPVNATGGKP